MLPSLLAQNGLTTSWLALGAGALTLYIAVWSFVRRLSKPRFDAPLKVYPYPDKEWIPFKSQHWLLTQNFDEYRDKFYKIWQPHGDVIILPLKYVDELRNLPEDKISFRQETEDRWSGSLVGMATSAHDASYPTSAKSVRNDMNRYLNGMMQDICEEAEYAFSKEAGPCDDWTEVNVEHFATTAVALISGRFFVGPELNRDPRYLKAIIEYTITVFTSAILVNLFPFFLRRLAALILPPVWTVRRSQREMERIMEPVIRKRLAAMAEKSAPENMTTWNLRNSRPEDRTNIRFQSGLQLTISMAAIHTTAMHTGHVLFDLAARPEYAQPLRDELDDALAASDSDFLDKKSMAKLSKLDSFVKESQRLNPMGVLTFVRKVMSPITLHDGTVLPKNSLIGVPSFAHARDAAKFEDPEIFEGFRFNRLREEAGMVNRLNFSETGLGKHDLITFGHGTHACPGRFFASAEIKVIMAHLLQHYDIRMPDGRGRVENVFKPGGYGPRPEETVLLRRRKAE